MKTKKNKSNKIYFALILVQLVITVFIAVHVSTSGSELKYLENTEVKLNRENDELLSQLVNDSSLTKLSVEAQNLGFVKPLATIYLSGESVVASLIR